MADAIKKLVEEVIRHKVDGLKFTKDQSLANFDSWMKNKAQNWSFQPQAVDSVFPLPQSE